MAYCHHAGHVAPLGRRSDRLRPVWLYVHHGDRRASASCCRKSWRTFAFGVGTAAGSFGQFLFSPLAVALIGAYGWQNTLVIFRRPDAARAADGACGQHAAGRSNVGRPVRRVAVARAGAHRSVLGIAPTCCSCSASSPAASSSRSSRCTCRAYLVDRGFERAGRRLDLGVIGLFNIIGSLGVRLARELPAQALHPVVHLFRARALGQCSLSSRCRPARRRPDLRRGHRPAVAVDGAADLGLVARDVRHALAHDAVRLRLLQPPGRRLPRRLARRHRLFERTGSYDVVWWLSVLFGVLSAVINLPIVEKPVARLAPAAA